MALSPLGLVAAELPVSVPLARLLVLGVTCGSGESDCVVMAAGMSLGQEPFALPHRSLAKSGKDFLKALTLSQVARQKADAGEYSDPLSYVRLYASWLEGPRSLSWTKKNGLSLPRLAPLYPFPLPAEPELLRCRSCSSSCHHNRVLGKV
jgi:hypothetical protein